MHVHFAILGYRDYEEYTVLLSDSDELLLGGIHILYINYNIISYMHDAHASLKWGIEILFPTHFFNTR